jgi:hypothetical protein
MSLLSASYLINETNTKFIGATIARTDTVLKPEVQIGKHKEEKVILSLENWKEFALHFEHFTDFFDGKLKNYQIQLVADNHLTYIYSRAQFGKSSICISQIRRNCDKPRFPAAFYFSRNTWARFVSVQPLIDAHLKFISQTTPIVWTKTLPALARVVFRLGGITKEACTDICCKLDNFNMTDFHFEELRPHENDRVLHEILLFNNDLVWERIFEIEMALA